MNHSPPTVPSDSDLDAEVWRYVAVFRSQGEPVEFRRQAEQVVAEANNRRVGHVRSNFELQREIQAQLAVELALEIDHSSQFSKERRPIEDRLVKYALYWAARWCLRQQPRCNHVHGQSSFPAAEELKSEVNRQYEIIRGAEAQGLPLDAAFWNRVELRIKSIYTEYLRDSQILASHATLAKGDRKVPRSVADVCRILFRPDASWQGYESGYYATYGLEDVLRDEVSPLVTISFLQRCGYLPSTPSWTYIKSAHGDPDSPDIQRWFSCAVFGRNSDASADARLPNWSAIEFAGKAILAAITAQGYLEPSRRPSIPEILIRISRRLSLERRTVGLPFYFVTSRQLLEPMPFAEHPQPPDIGDAWVHQVREQLGSARRLAEDNNASQHRSAMQKTLAREVWGDVFELVHERLTGVPAHVTDATMAHLVGELTDSWAFRTWQAVQNWAKRFEASGSLRFWSELYVEAICGILPPLGSEKLYPPPWAAALALVALGGSFALDDLETALRWMVDGKPRAFNDRPASFFADAIDHLKLRRDIHLHAVQRHEHGSSSSVSNQEVSALNHANQTSNDEISDSLEKLRQIRRWARVAGMNSVRKYPCIIVSNGPTSTVDNWSISKNVFALWEPREGDDRDRTAEKAALWIAVENYIDEWRALEATYGGVPHFREDGAQNGLLSDRLHVQGIEVWFTMDQRLIDRYPAAVRRHVLISTNKGVDELTQALAEHVARYGPPKYSYINWTRKFAKWWGERFSLRTGSYFTWPRRLAKLASLYLNKPTDGPSNTNDRT